MDADCFLNIATVKPHKTKEETPHDDRSLPASSSALDVLHGDESGSLQARIQPW